MTWIRVDVSIPEDQTVHSLADQLGVRPNEAIGLLVSMRGKFPAHARSGDLSQVPDTLVEKWAGWHGKAGRFASALRALVLNDHGVDEGWLRTNAAMLKATDAAADRMARLREKRAAAAAQLLELGLAEVPAPSGAFAEPFAERSPNGSLLHTNRHTKSSTAARARGREPAAYPKGSQPPGSGAPWCEHCDGELVTPPGQRRPVRVHLSECPNHLSPEKAST